MPPLQTPHLRRRDSKVMNVNNFQFPPCMVLVTLPRYGWLPPFYMVKPQQFEDWRSLQENLNLHLWFLCGKKLGKLKRSVAILCEETLSLRFSSFSSFLLSPPPLFPLLLLHLHFTPPPSNRFLQILITACFI